MDKIFKIKLIMILIMIVATSILAYLIFNNIINTENPIRDWIFASFGINLITFMVSIFIVNTMLETEETSYMVQERVIGDRRTYMISRKNFFNNYVVGNSEISYNSYEDACKEIQRRLNFYNVKTNLLPYKKVKTVCRTERID